LGKKKMTVVMPILKSINIQAVLAGGAVVGGDYQASGLQWRIFDSCLSFTCTIAYENGGCTSLLIIG
jgi:hypothetical protein